MDNKSLERLELNKILSAASNYCTLEGGAALLRAVLPSADIVEVRERLRETFECDKLLYNYGIGKIEHFDEVTEILTRAGKGSALGCGELLSACALLRSARVAYTQISKIDDGEIILMRRLADSLYFDSALEEDITSKIISPDAVADTASDRLFSLRQKIRSLNERIRSKLGEYVTGKNAAYLQDTIVTIRNDRYVIPVKAEHKNHVRGFIHDRSQTGATFFIEPEYVLELNNELIALTIDEREEVEAILKALSKRIGEISEQLIADSEALYEIDSRLARAEYAYSQKCVMPEVNARGEISIVKGRHPLIDKNTVVPVSVELGTRYNFLLLSGANTGGKTVTLKMCGLFCLMAACGFFVPAASGTRLAVFGDIFCDVGDSQSIEESLSTFSSHITNVISICRGANSESLVLIDELGGGTNPDEGQAIAKAVVKHLLDKGARGIVTTHFTPLKEFAYTVNGIENASMEFDSTTLKPLYSIKIGMPGASNALAITRRLGMDEKILAEATEYLSEGARSFENVVRRAEESRVAADEKLAEAAAAEREWRKKLDEVNAQIAALNAEREKLNRSARSESRRIISERTAKAEELLGEMEQIFKKQDLSEADIIRARTLTNRIEDVNFSEEQSKKKVVEYSPATPQTVKEGLIVYVKAMETRGQITSYQQGKKEAEVQCGSIKLHCKLSDLLIVGAPEKRAEKVKVVKKLPKDMPVLEINLLGLTVPEALYEVDNFIDRAVTDNLEEIKVIHGVGTGKLKAAITEHLKKHKNVESFRAGKYGEGEQGVTFIKLK